MPTVAKKKSAKVQISASIIQKTGGVVVLPLPEYQELIRQAKPTYYLQGREASQLDKLVQDGITEHRAGRTKAVASLTSN